MIFPLFFFQTKRINKLLNQQNQANDNNAYIYAYFWNDHVRDTSNHSYEIENIPRITEVVLEAEGQDLENRLDSEYASERDIQILENGLYILRLIVPLHHENNGVDSDEEQDEVLEAGRDHQRPDFELERLFVRGHIPLDRLGVYGKVHAGFHVLVDLATG